MPAEGLRSRPGDSLARIFAALDVPPFPALRCLGTQLSEWLSNSNVHSGSSAHSANHSGRLVGSSPTDTPSTYHMLRAFFTRYATRRPLARTLMPRAYDPQRSDPQVQCTAAGPDLNARSRVEPALALSELAAGDTCRDSRRLL